MLDNFKWAAIPAVLVIDYSPLKLLMIFGLWGAAISNHPMFEYFVKDMQEKADRKALVIFC